MFKRIRNSVALGIAGVIGYASTSHAALDLTGVTLPLEAPEAVAAIVVVFLAGLFAIKAALSFLRGR